MGWPDEVQYAKDSNGNVIGLDKLLQEALHFINVNAGTGVDVTAELQTVINIKSELLANEIRWGESGRRAWNSGIVVKIPAGVHSITGITVPCGVTLKGSSMYGSVLRITGSNSVGIQKQEVANLYAENGITLESIHIESDGSAGQTGILFDTADDWVLRDVLIEGFANKGLWCKKTQYGRAFNLQVIGCGTGVLLEQNADNYPCNNNHFFGLQIQKCGTGARIGGHANGIHGGTIQANTVAGLVVAAESNGTYNTLIENVHFEYHPTVWDTIIESPVKATNISNCFYVVPAGLKTGVRFIKNTGSGTVVSFCSQQAVAINVVGSEPTASNRSDAAVIEQTSTDGSILVIGGVWGSGLTEQNIVVDETGSKVSTNFRTRRRVIGFGAGTADTSFAGGIRVWSGTVADGISGYYGTNANPRYSLSGYDGANSTGCLLLGNGSAAPVDGFKYASSGVISMIGNNSFSIPSATASGGIAPLATLRMGANHMWVDSSGRLRIKSSAPTTETDGTVVGAQV